jgi:starch phosphorylase
MNKNNPTSSLKPMRASKPTTDLYQLPSLGMDDTALALDIRRYFGNFLGRDHHCRSTHYPYQALALALRDRLMERWKRTRYAYEARDARHAYYLSLEFLMGRTLGNALLNLGLDDAAAPALRHLGLDLEEMIDVEHDAGLGNGGLGRLAACFLDSCATLQLPVMGYGIRYEYGMFRQRIEHGRQMRSRTTGCATATPGSSSGRNTRAASSMAAAPSSYRDAHGRTRCPLGGHHDVLAVPYDTPIPGYRNDTVNVLRLWSAAATDEFNLGEFNAGSYTESVAAKNAAENITMVLYPNDASENGKELRLRQQYFLASASLQDVLDRWELNGMARITAGSPKRTASSSTTPTRAAPCPNSCAC